MPLNHNPQTMFKISIVSGICILLSEQGGMLFLFQIGGKITGSVFVLLNKTYWKMAGYFPGII